MPESDRRDFPDNPVQVQQPIAGSDIQATYKARDVEGLLDIHFYRKVGFHLAHFFAKWNLTPAAVTWLGTLIGMVAGHFYFYRDLRLNALGMALHIICNALDNADGQLARMTNRGSRDGRIVDGLGDFLVFASIYLHLCLRCLAAGGSDLIWFIAISAGASHLIQTAVADYLRNAYVYFVSGNSRGEFDTSAALRKEFSQLSWRTAPWQKFLLRIYLNYTRQQEMLVPRVKKVKRRIEERSSIDDGQWLMKRYRRGNKSIIKCANLFGRNSRMALLFVLLVLDLPAWYFVFELTVFNLLLAFVLFWQAKAFRRFLGRIERVPIASLR